MKTPWHLNDREFGFLWIVLAVIVLIVLATHQVSEEMDSLLKVTAIFLMVNGFVDCLRYRWYSYKQMREIEKARKSYFHYV